MDNIFLIGCLLTNFLISLLLDEQPPHLEECDKGGKKTVKLIKYIKQLFISLYFADFQPNSAISIALCLLFLIV